jgi:tetratricopeptide (TPR) repeat protein
MLSKKPLLNSNSSLDSPFLQENASELDSIKLFADLSEGFTFGCMVVDSDVDRNLVVNYFEQVDQPNSVQWISIKLEDENLQFFGLEVHQQLQAINLQNDQKPVLLISGLENSIGVNGEYPEILVNMNMERDDYPRILPHPTILLLPSYAVTRMARYAPDFWSWKSTEVQLKKIKNNSLNSSKYFTISSVGVNICGGLYTTSDYTHNIESKENVQNSKEVISKATNTTSETMKEETYSRLDFLEKMLSKNWEPTTYRAKLLYQLGDEYRYIYNNTKAKKAYQSALDIYRNSPSLLDESRSLSGLAEIYELQGKYLESLDLWQKSLVIQIEIGDQLGKAITLYHLSKIYQKQRDLSKALDYSEQALKINKEIASQKGTADSLGQTSNIYRESGKLLKSLDYSEQSLKIYQKIDERQGEADALCQLSIIHEELGNSSKSLTYSEQALEIYQEIGDKPGEADALYAKSKIYRALGEFQKSVDLALQSLKICQETGDRAMEKDVSDQLTRIRQALTD